MTNPDRSGLSKTGAGAVNDQDPQHRRLKARLNSIGRLIELAANTGAPEQEETLNRTLHTSKTNPLETSRKSSTIYSRMKEEELHKNIFALLSNAGISRNHWEATLITAIDKLRSNEAAAKPVWREKPAEDKRLSPPDFIKKYYAAELAAGTLTKRQLRIEDRPLVIALRNWETRTGGTLDFSLPSAPSRRELELEKRFGDDATDLLHARREFEKLKMRLYRKRNRDSSEPS